MLDQNTDRMWFVIGALVVGAGIIFIANGTLPELFASVTESFEEASDNALSVVDEVVPTTSAQNILIGYEWQHGGFQPDDSEFTRGLLHQHIAEHIPTNGASKVTVELLEDVPEFAKSAYGRINAYDVDKQVISTPLGRLDEYEPYKVSAELPEGTEYIRVFLIHGDIGKYRVTLE